MFSWIFLVTFILSTAANVIQDVTIGSAQVAEKLKGGCPESLNLTTLNNGKKYYFSTGSKNWFDSKQFCEANEMHLASPKTMEELAELHNKANTVKAVMYWWVSLTNRGHARNDFRWHDGERVALNSTLWNNSAQQPDQYLEGSSAYIHTAAAAAGLWDFYCLDPENSFICECNHV